jgi:hypothetical protein
MRNLLLAGAALYGVHLLLLRGWAARPVAATAPPPLNRREYADWLANGLVISLSYGDWRMWDGVFEECRHIGRGDLPGHMRDKHPFWAEQMDRNRARELGE